MSANCKRNLSAYLRTCCIAYVTQRDFISIGNFHLFFNDTWETITIRTPICPYLDFTFHYASPDIILSKYLQFKELVKTFLAYKEAAQFKGHSIIGLS